MAQGSIVAAQTPLLVSDFIDRLKREDNSYASPTENADFLTPFKSVLPSSAKSYSGVYFKVPSQTSAPMLFSSPFYSGAAGNIYEENVPTDCIDGGISAIHVRFGSSGMVNEANILNQTENTWDLTSALNCYWEQRARKFRMYVPLSYASSGSLKHTENYEREPTYPQVTGDAIDYPADDIETLYQNWKARVV